MRKKVIDLVNLVTGSRFTEQDILNKDYVDEEMLDSIEFINLIVEIEDMFSIEILQKDLLIEKFRNYESICEIIKEYTEI